MRFQGFITAEQITAHGLGVTRWIQWVDAEHPWVAMGAVRGQWVETEYMPPFDKQPSEQYELNDQRLAAELSKQFTLQLLKAECQ